MRMNIVQLIADHPLNTSRQCLAIDAGDRSTAGSPTKPSRSTASLHVGYSAICPRPQRDTATNDAATASAWRHRASVAVGGPKKCSPRSRNPTVKHSTSNVKCTAIHGIAGMCSAKVHSTACPQRQACMPAQMSRYVYRSYSMSTRASR